MFIIGNSFIIEIPYTYGIDSSSLAKEIDALGTTPEARMKKLRRLINAKPIVRIMESHCGLTGLIIENLNVETGGENRQFDGMWSSSLTDSTSKGKPDIEAVDLTNRLHPARRGNPPDLSLHHLCTGWHY